MIQTVMAKRVRAVLKSIRQGHLTVINPDGSREEFGDKGEHPSATIRVHDDRLWASIACQGSIGLGEAYVDSLWDVEGCDLVDFLAVILVNIPSHRRSMVRQAIHRAASLIAAPMNKALERRDVRHHYDRGNELFQLFLDKSMTYSCGYQAAHGQSLEDMQSKKYDMICSKVDLTDGDTVADLGCGWGGFLVHVAKRYPRATGVGVTLSSKQAKSASERVSHAGAGDRFRVHCEDFSTLTGAFDRVVSIGMFEHLRHSDYAPFFRHVRNLLKPNGSGLVQTMGTSEGLHVPPDPWISKYVFPGHRLPRLDEILKHCRESGLRVGHVENLKPHYAETFRRWHDRFQANREQVLRLPYGYDEKFIRLWAYYLKNCQAGFAYGRMQLYQIAFDGNE